MKPLRDLLAPLLAVALMEGNLAIRHYDQLYYKRADVRALMQKITVRIDDELVAAWPEVPLNIVDAELKSGNVFSTRVAYHLGHFKRFMTDETQSIRSTPSSPRPPR